MTLDHTPLDDPTGEGGLPTWSVADLHESLSVRSVADAFERLEADLARLVALFDQHDIRAGDRRPVTADDAEVADAVLRAYNASAAHATELGAVIRSVTSTDSRDEQAQSLLSRVQAATTPLTPLLARLAEWVDALGVGELAAVSEEVAAHAGPLTRLRERVAHQMSEAEESLYAELTPTGSAAWSQLQRTMTSQLTAEVTVSGGEPRRLPMPAVRGLASHPDPTTRRAAFDAELAVWPSIAMPVAAALNAVKGEANVVNRRRHWDSPLDASLFANSVSRPTYDAMTAAVHRSFPDLRRWMRTKARLHGHADGLPWWDLVAPLPDVDTSLSWDAGVDWVRDAFGSYSAELGGLVDRALDERWIDAPPRDGKSGGAFCMPVAGDRSLVLLNWSDSLQSAQTTAHELGHAYHNVTLAHRTPLQRRLPMALAETASIFCETLAIEAGLVGAEPERRLAVLDTSIGQATQVVVDIASRVRFETELFERRDRGAVGVSDLNAMMLDAQAATYGDGIDLDTRHPFMWLLKPHYYSSHFYNWPYTYGLLFGLGLFAAYRSDPDRFRVGYDELLSRAGMDTAEELGESFGLDVTDEAFWEASLDVIRGRIADYERIAHDRSDR